MNTAVSAPSASSRLWIPGAASQPRDDKAGEGHLTRPHSLARMWLRTIGQICVSHFLPLKTP